MGAPRVARHVLTACVPLVLALAPLAHAAGPSPEASHRLLADAQLRLPAVGGRYVLLDLEVAGPPAGYPSQPGRADAALRWCAGSTCDAPATYRQLLTPSQLRTAQDGSEVTLSATLMGIPVRLTWSTDSDYQAHPTLVVNNGAVTGQTGGYVLLPADRDADASGVLNGRRCRARLASLTSQVVAGTPQAEHVTPAPARLPSRFRLVQRAGCG